MKRFVKVYLTLLIVALLSTNLILVLLYGQRFLLNAAGETLAVAGETKAAVVYLNLTVLAVFAVFWLIARYYYRHTLPNRPSDREKW